MTEETVRQPKFSYQDIPQLHETFADSVGQWFFDGHTLRIEFMVSRLDEPKPNNEAPTGRRVPVSRLVLTPAGANELLRLFRQLAASLEKATSARQTADKEPARPN